MKIKCYAVLDHKLSEFHLAVFDIKDQGAIRQFTDAVLDKQTKWNKHPEDYSLWKIGEFDTEKGELKGCIQQNLINATAILGVTGSVDEKLEATMVS